MAAGAVPGPPMGSVESESPAHTGSRNESVGAAVAQTQLFLGHGASTLGPVFGFFSMKQVITVWGEQKLKVDCEGSWEGSWGPS